MIDKFYRVFYWFTVVFIIALTVGSFFIQDKKLKDETSTEVIKIIDNKDINKLKNMGYSSDDIKVIQNDKDLVTIILKREYNKKIIELAKNKHFNKKDLDLYLDYYQNNPTLTSDQVIESINNKK